MVACLAAVAGFCQALAKLSLDALIQRDVPELVRSSAFARSETLLQMAWVLGGAIGIALPLVGALGLRGGRRDRRRGLADHRQGPARLGPPRGPRPPPGGLTPAPRGPGTPLPAPGTPYPRDDPPRRAR